MADEGMTTEQQAELDAYMSAYRQRYPMSYIGNAIYIVEHYWLVTDTGIWTLDGLMPGLVPTFKFTSTRDSITPIITIDSGSVTSMFGF